MAHDHSHHHSGKNLKTAFFINLAFTIIEIIGGLLTNSVAILSDAVHDLGDSISLGLAWFLDRKSQIKATDRFSFGYARFSLLGALINSIVLIAGSIYVIREAVIRLIEPQQSDADGMILFALLGIVVNGYAAWKLSGGRTLNEKVVSWHLVEDVLGWVAVLIVAIILKFHYSPYLDPALSLFITAYILWNVVKRLRETLFVFLQGVPNELNMTRIQEDLLSIENVASLHHTHIWSLDGDHHVFTTHIKLVATCDMKSFLDVKKALQAKMDKYNFKHHTIELELDVESCGLDPF